MAIFPEHLIIRITDDSTNLPLEKIAIIITLFAKIKNNYHFIANNISDINGVINISKDWIEHQIDDAINLFVMDYASALNDCQQKIEIKIISDKEIKGAIKSLRLFGDSVKNYKGRIALLKKAYNGKYQSVTRLFDLPTNLPEITLSLSTKRVKK